MIISMSNQINQKKYNIKAGNCKFIYCINSVVLVKFFLESLAKPYTRYKGEKYYASGNDN